MATSLALIGLFYLATGLGLLAILIKPLKSPDKPSTEGFVLALTAAATNSLAEGLNLLDPEYTFSLATWYVRVFGSAVATAGWLLLAVGFVTRRAPKNRHRLPLYAYIAVLGTAIIVDNAFLSDSIFIADSGRGWAEITVWALPNWAFWTNAMINYGFLFGGTALLLVEAIQTNGLRRKQAALLVAASLPPGVTNVLIVSGTITPVYDLTIFGFAIAVVLFAIAIYRMSVLELTPVARQTAMEEMDDAVITLDDTDRVVDCNAAARKLFDISESGYFGTPATDCFPPVVTEQLDQHVTTADVDTQITVPHDGVEGHFSLSISPIRASEQSGGRIVVLRDITPIKQRETALESREEELDLLRQVFSRVLRHNIRNELTVIHGSADDLTERADAPIADQAALICEASEDLLDLSEKARYIERVIDSEDGLVEADLRTIAEEAAETIRQRSPEATIEVTGAKSCPVECNPELDAAVENLVENAVEHNTGEPTVRIEVGEADGRARLTVTDDGPGIEPDELAVLNAQSETQLSHGSGIGLWLVKWVVDRSRAELTFATSADGTDVTIQFDHRATPGAKS